VAPFDAAAVVLVVGGAIVYSTWTENLGDTSASEEPAIEGFKKAARLIASGEMKREAVVRACVLGLFGRKEEKGGMSDA